MKQTSQAAPDFTELLKHASDIFTVNKQFGQVREECRWAAHVYGVFTFISLNQYNVCVLA